MDAKLKYKAKKIKVVFFDIDDTLRSRLLDEVRRAPNIRLCDHVTMDADIL